MIIPDVNILVGALQPDDPNHGRLVRWLGNAVNGREQVGFSHAVLTGTVRVLTNARIFRQPPKAGTVVELLDQLLSAPAATIVVPGQHNWAIFRDLCGQAAATGNLVSDAFHAALAIEHKALLVTLDRDFRQFDGLRVASPYDE